MKIIANPRRAIYDLAIEYTDTATLGADFSMHRRWQLWQIASTAAAVRASSDDLRTAERYLGEFTAQRALTMIVALSAGERAERDRLAGMDFRSILDLGLSWAVVRSSQWTLDATTAAAWNHESLSGLSGVVRVSSGSRSRG